ncbi:hypothetical protein SUGI_0645780 [Cryptomeria japonica]|uniref:uncharacterized protein LOC131067307 n=1 Tax=Cryptomeria japonica TaxID=3369 RepID=UPI0024149E2E|nr:uncharacterized protein LOC131067307 [Cryptomeria japonica]GLJ32068.1 hypothetical protein SUGI_0645780 [Cryptomeria japonica]
MGIEEMAVSEFDNQSSIRTADRIKFLYSYGGRIVPRHGDWKLRYVGGDTRVMAADRNITFADLMAKMAEVLGSSPVLKCQLPNQDPDALVSIKSDEDLHNILEEYNRQGIKQGSSKVRAFLFPRTRNPSKQPVAPTSMAARTGCRHPSHQPRRATSQSPYARSDYQYNTSARCASKTIPDRAISSGYMEYQHCLRSFFINNRSPSPLCCHYYTSPSPFPSTQNTQQHIRSYMKVA